MLCSSIPGAELSDKEFRRLFFRSACQADLAVNDTWMSSLKLYDAKIEELQNRADQLEATNISVQQPPLYFAEKGHGGVCLFCDVVYVAFPG